MDCNIIFNDSEIDLLLGETTAKDEVGELQTEASDGRCPVNEYKSADVENDKLIAHQPVAEKLLEPQDLAIEEQKQVGDGEKEKRLGSVELAHDVQSCIGDKVNEISCSFHSCQ